MKKLQFYYKSMQETHTFKQSKYDFQHWKDY